MLFVSLGGQRTVESTMKTTGNACRVPIENEGVAVLFDAENISPCSTSMVVEQAMQ
jgi:hypothetical protein